ncbi:MAG: hypothetical protein HYU97_02995 [Deltaproteobacteria bacterium]|nr:hypothetical protein [Deltaproteobacteria bacterium]
MQKTKILTPFLIAILVGCGSPTTQNNNSTENNEPTGKNETQTNDDSSQTENNSDKIADSNPTNKSNPNTNCSNDAIIQITEYSQDVVSVTETGVANFALTACSPFNLNIKYKWTLQGSDEALSINKSLSYQTSSSQGGQVLNIVGTAYVDANNTTSQIFKLKVINIDFFNLVGTYNFNAPIENKIPQYVGLAKYQNKLFIGIGNGAISGSPGYLEVVDLTNPQTPIFNGLFETANNPIPLIKDNILFVQGCLKGPLTNEMTANGELLSIYDLSTNPIFPNVVSMSSLQKGVGGCYSNGHLALNESMNIIYVNYSTFIDIYNIDSLESPILESAFRIGDPSGSASGTSLKYFNNHIFLIGEQQIVNPPHKETHLHIRNVTNPANPIELPSYFLEDSWSNGMLFQDKLKANILYAFTQNLNVLDVSDPTQIKSAGKIGLPSVPLTAITTKNLAITGGYNGQVQVYDLSNLSVSSNIGDLDTGNGKIGALLADDSFLYVLTSEHLLIYDISDL